METDKYILLLSVHVSYPRSDGFLRTKAKAVPLGTCFEWRHGLDDGLIYNAGQHKSHGYNLSRTVPSAAFRTTWLSRGSIYDMARGGDGERERWRVISPLAAISLHSNLNQLERLAPRYAVLWRQWKKNRFKMLFIYVLNYYDNYMYPKLTILTENYQQPKSHWKSFQIFNI